MQRDHTLDPIRERALALVQRYGWNATSFQALEPGLEYWFSLDGEACIAYADTGSAWVAAGAPLAAEERFLEIVGAFSRRPRSVSGGCASSEPSVDSNVWSQCNRWRSVSSQCGIPPAGLKSCAPAAALREQIRRAEAKRVIVRQIPPEELADPTHPTRVAIEALVPQWLRGRRMAPLEFLVQVDLFSHQEARRIFAAERDGRSLAFWRWCRCTLVTAGCSGTCYAIPGLPTEPLLEVVARCSPGLADLG
jgi:phosphatidylglycerol lysyltransferase